jgi:4-diphosphocytidyl-2-C-methyl-D-erythritol kinase
MPEAVAFEARAKLNLGLAIGPRRPDGFHDLATFFQSISLADTLIARRARGGFSLRIRYENAALGAVRRADRISAGRSNLVLRTAREVAARSGLERGARFELIKRIPSGAGLGGGSADAAATIAALDALYQLELGAAVRRSIALEIGSDVPFALRGGTALGLGRGERLKRIRPSRAFRALIAVPRWRISTAAAYAEIDRKKFGLTGWKAKLRSTQLRAVGRLKPERALGLGNTFERVLGKRRKGFLSLRARLRAAGLTCVAMTGSGSAVFGLIDASDSSSRVAQRFKGSETLYAVRSVGAGLRRVAVD